ncbi:MAG: response regulator [Usitatibacter sp.]
MKALKRVLVIDDDPVVGTSFNRVLTPKGYAVITAANGDEALAKIAREDYDVVYTDIKMPGMNGLEVARRIKEARPWMPVVIVTGYGTDANVEEAKRLGVAGFLNKPLTPETIEGTTTSFTLPEEAAEAAAPAAAETAAVPEKLTPARFAKNIALFIAAPFIALGYVVIGPIVGLGMLAWFGARALTGRGKGTG